MKSAGAIVHVVASSEQGFVGAELCEGSDCDPRREDDSKFRYATCPIWQFLSVVGKRHFISAVALPVGCLRDQQKHGRKLCLDPMADAVHDS